MQGDRGDKRWPPRASCVSARFSHEPGDLEAWKADAVLDEESEVLGLSEKGRAGGDSTHSPAPPQESLPTGAGLGGWDCENPRDLPGSLRGARAVMWTPRPLDQGPGHLWPGRHSWGVGRVGSSGDRPFPEHRSRCPSIWAGDPAPRSREGQGVTMGCCRPPPRGTSQRSRRSARCR